jgi:hypothetical protein
MLQELMVRIKQTGKKLMLDSNYHEMSKQISCATTVLEDSSTAAGEIDRVLNGKARPSYVQPLLHESTLMLSLAMLLHSQPV